MLAERLLPLIEDECIEPNDFKVYVKLVQLTGERIFYEPCPVKGDLLARMLGLKRETVYAALDTLVGRGHLTELGRGLHNVRRLFAPATCPPDRTITHAA